MEVTPNSGTGPAQRVTGKSPVTPRAKAAATDLASFRNTDAVNSALQQAPDIRPEAVQRATEQVADVQYPPLSTIKAISNLLALRASQNDGQE